MFDETKIICIWDCKKTLAVRQRTIIVGIIKKLNNVGGGQLQDSDDYADR